MLEATLQGKLQEHLSEKYRREKGWLLYSGLDTLRPGRYYFMGFNPAKDPANKVLNELFPAPPCNWSAYTQQCWRCGGALCEHIDANGRVSKPKRHQRSVREFIEKLAHQPEDVFATNAIFVESESIQELCKRPDFSELWDRCWEIHRWFLSIVQPQWIICLGNAGDLSAYSLLRKRCLRDDKGRDEKDYKKGKVFTGSIDLEGGQQLGVRVLGVPHPSWFNLPSPTTVSGLLDETS